MFSLGGGVKGSPHILHLSSKLPLDTSLYRIRIHNIVSNYKLLSYPILNNTGNIV